MTNLKLTSDQIYFLLQEVSDNNVAWQTLANDPKYANETESYGSLKNKTYTELTSISDAIYDLLIEKMLLIEKERDLSITDET